ncbi:MAG: N-acetylmuramoyl-L-alanine amidase CwlD, partial [Oscillospiraceae bacterium]|nr:N-acetylmuramoyl-L-alanine amidase CwlD [Oscillospiraceae bacterium]
MVINKRQLILFTIIVLTSIVIISAIFVGCNTAATASTTKNSPPTIVIDAGHGGEDGGAVAPDGTN